MTTRFRTAHAVIATAALATIVLANGTAAAWRQFLHGLDLPNGLPASKLILMLVAHVVIFGGLLAILAFSTLFTKTPKTAWPDAPDAPAGWRRFLPVLRWTVPVILATFAIEWISVTALQSLFGLELAQQDMIKWLKPGVYSTPVRAVLCTFILFAAPLIEEPLFRGVLLKGFATRLPFWTAATISSLIFALVHVNAATVLPLVFLGLAFSWLYRRTGTLLAPMAAHFTFNLVNLVLCLAFPELTTA